MTARGSGSRRPSGASQVYPQPLQQRRGGRTPRRDLPGHGMPGGGARGDAPVAAQDECVGLTERAGRTLAALGGAQQVGIVVHRDRGAQPRGLAVQGRDPVGDGTGGEAASGWARAIAVTSGRARYTARCPQASGGAPAGRVSAVSGISTSSPGATRSSSFGGVMSMYPSWRTDTCPNAVTSPRPASTCAASTSTVATAAGPAAEVVPSAVFMTGRARRRRRASGR